MLPVWAELVLVAAASWAVRRAWRLRQRIAQLEARLQARERESHFLGESPDPRLILQHAFRAASEILPLSRFDLYRVDASQRITEVWTLPPERHGVERRPESDPRHPRLGDRVDSRAVELQFAATETERSFAPIDLLPGAEPTQVLHLPLYSGDALVAYLILVSPGPSRKGARPRSAPSSRR